MCIYNYGWNRRSYRLEKMATSPAGEVPIRVDNPNIGSVQKQLQRKEQDTTLLSTNYTSN